MRYFAYFTVPTLVGWFVGSLSCIAAMATFGRDAASIKDFYQVAQVAGILIIAPTFFLCILPYCGIAIRSLHTSNTKSHCRFHALPLFLWLVGFGSIITFLLAAAMFLPEHSFRSSLPPENPLLWFLPFIPYAAVVAALSRLLYGVIQSHDT